MKTGAIAKAIILCLVSILLTVAWVSAGMVHEAWAAGEKPPLDIVMVLDNSLSMKNNDPQALTKQVASNFINGLSSDARVGLVIFSGKTDMALPLTALQDDNSKKQALRVLEQVDFSGQNTDIPGAIERALYELKQHGRNDAAKAIVFMTDGLVETGDRANDQERTRWLKEELAGESQKLSIRIFGVAFTEQADYTLIQTLGQKTGGGYYRVMKAEDIQGAFSSIQAALTTPAANAAPAAATPVPAATKNNSMIWVYSLAFVVLVIAAVAVLGRKRETDGNLPADPIPVGIGDMPEARLEDVKRVTGQGAFQLRKRSTTIGRVNKGETNPNLDIGIPSPGVSALHAVIEFKNGHYYLIDRRSTNGTWLNEARIMGETELKSGDIIAFDDQKFKFVLSGKTDKDGNFVPAPQSGGTVLKPGAGTPPAPPAPGKWPADIGETNMDADDDRTFFKQGMCANHPSYKAVGFCRIDGLEFCEDCLVEHEGTMICKHCFSRLNK